MIRILMHWGLIFINEYQVLIRHVLKARRWSVPKLNYENIQAC